MKAFLALALLLALSAESSWSQTQTISLSQGEPASTPVLPSESDLKDADDLVRVDLLWNKLVDWKEKGSSVADIAAHLRPVLGDKITVEVRGGDANRSTFELPQAPLGPTLSSVASLASTKLWVFPGRLLLAPEALLTPKENALIKAGMGGRWKESSTGGGMGWNSFDKFQKIALTLVGADLKERFAAKGLTPIKPPPGGFVSLAGGVLTPPSSFVMPPLAYELPLGDLSPTTKDILQKLRDVDAMRWQTPNRPFTPPRDKEALDASTIVGFDDTQGRQLQLRLQKVDPQGATKRSSVGSWYASKS